MLSFNQYLNQVNEAIAAIEYPAQPQRLYQPIAYTMALGGKRVRPVLTLMACDALGGDMARATDAAVAVEMFHNFTLLHDDVMDRADVRRGQPTVHRKWNDNVAILSGDTMLTLATQIMARTGDMRLIHLFNRTAIEIYEGQQWDMDFEQRDDVTLEEYMHMIRLKTSVLLGCALQAGAIVAGASDDKAQALYDMGVNMGLAFQLQDDWLDVWGDTATFGKEIGGDIMNNKKTFLLINALQKATGDTAAELRRWLNDNDAPRHSKVAAVTAIYDALRLSELAQQEIARYSALALESLERALLGGEAHHTFAQFIARLTHRNN